MITIETVLHKGREYRGFFSNKLYLSYFEKIKIQIFSSNNCSFFLFLTRCVTAKASVSSRGNFKSITISSL